MEGDDGMMELLYPADEMMEVEEEEGWLRGRRRLNSNSEEEQLPFRAIQAKPDFHRPYHGRDGSRKRRSDARTGLGQWPPGS